MHNPVPVEANGTPQAVQGIRLGKNSLATVQDLEIALNAAVHVNKLLNEELQKLSEQLQHAEADKHAWQAHARRLAMQLAQHKLAAGKAICLGCCARMCASYVLLLLAEHTSCP
jgi:glutathione S-transferase